MKFNWDDLIKGLNNNVDVVAGAAEMAKKAINIIGTIGSFIPGLPTKVENPITLIMDTIDFITTSKNDKVKIGIDNETALVILEKISKSTHNKIDDKVVCMIKAYIDCDDYDNNNEDKDNERK